jgi:hypothetical protein
MRKTPVEVRLTIRAAHDRELTYWHVYDALFDYFAGFDPTVVVGPVRWRPVGTRKWISNDPRDAGRN